MGNNPLNELTLFVTSMVALSMAAERVTETIKQFLNVLLARLPRSISTAFTQCIAVFSGIIVVTLSGQNPLAIPGVTAASTGNQPWSWVVGGVLVAGGSAFWNHLLDILKAAKVQKEDTVNMMVPRAEKITA